MDICANGHVEVVWSEGRNCHLCSSIEENKELESKIEDLEA